MDRFIAEYVEKELQKQSALQVSIVWDKVCALAKGWHTICPTIAQAVNIQQKVVQSTTRQPDIIRNFAVVYPDTRL